MEVRHQNRNNNNTITNYAINSSSSYETCAQF